jgi:hypothetical protein
MINSQPISSLRSMRSYKEAKEMIQNDEIDIIMEIPENYERTK